MANQAENIWDFDDDNKIINQRLFHLVPSAVIDTRTSEDDRVLVTVIGEYCHTINPYTFFNQPPLPNGKI